ncbi:MAG: hypothetical protein ACFE85_04600 [Candidatus Hodarchaeota archaeon]
MSLNQRDEVIFYEKLAKLLINKDFAQFNKLLENLKEKKLIFNPLNVPNRFEILSELLMKCIRNVAEGYQSSSLGEFVEILKFFNKFNLIERELSRFDLNTIQKVKKDQLLLYNLEDLFGKITNSFIFYIYNEIPNLLYDMLYRSFKDLQFYYFPSPDDFVNYVKFVFFNQYSIYGLIVKYLGPVEQFINEFNKFYSISKENRHIKSSELLNENRDFCEFDIIYKYMNYYDNYEEDRNYYVIKKHLVSPKSILNNKQEILARDVYKFFSLSMVLLGGVGPQGMGFTYSTPKGELVEICSDIQENQAIIIKYKQFLKDQFLKRLERELTKLNIGIKQKIIEYLSSVLNPKELINYLKRDKILYKVEKFISELGSFQNGDKFEELVENISKSVSIILRPIKMIDQFKARMKLVNENKLKSEDIAKLTSLKNKSHYDILRERVFYQYIVDWFYDIYLYKKDKL